MRAMLLPLMSDGVAAVLIVIGGLAALAALIWVLGKLFAAAVTAVDEDEGALTVGILVLLVFLAVALVVLGVWLVFR